MASLRIFFTGCYTQAGYSYHFSHQFIQWLSRELTERVEASEAFTHTYPDFSLVIWLNAHSDISEPVLRGSSVRKRDKQIEFYLILPHAGGPCPSSTKAYEQPVKWLLESVADILRRLGLDASRVVKDTSALVEHFVNSTDSISNRDWSNTEVEQQLKTRGTVPKPLPAPWVEMIPTRATEKKAAKKPKPKANPTGLPNWRIPRNIAKRVEAEDGMWEDERFDPILLTVMSGNSYQGREIPLTWQIEFDPYDDRLAAASEKIESLGIEPDGDDWAEFIEKKFAKRYPKLTHEFHSDSESSSCVIWVESENACQKLIELVWSLANPA